jgi:hypothetical protein
MPPVTSARGHLTVETLRSTRCDGSDDEAFLVLRPAFCLVPPPIRDLERSEDSHKELRERKAAAAEKIWFLNQEGLKPVRKDKPMNTGEQYETQQHLYFELIESLWREREPWPFMSRESLHRELARPFDEWTSPDSVLLEFAHAVLSPASPRRFRKERTG